MPTIPAFIPIVVEQDVGDLAVVVGRVADLNLKQDVGQGLRQLPAVVVVQRTGAPG